MNNGHLSKAAEALNELIAEYRKLVGEKPIVAFTGFEVDCGIPALVEHVVLQVRAVSELAKLSPDFASAAAGSARSAMEVAALAVWLATPKDPYVREGRWLGYFRTLGDHYRKTAAELKLSDPEVARDIETVMSKYIDGMTGTRFGREVALISKPSLKQMMTDVNYGHLYPGYRTACEIVHGGPETIMRHRRTHKTPTIPMGFEFGLFPIKQDWPIIFKMSGWGVGVSGYHCARILGFRNDACSQLFASHKRLNQIIDTAIE